MGEGVVSVVPRLLTAAEVAEILQVSRSEVYGLKAKIGFIVVGCRRIRFEPDAVLAYVQAQRRCPEPAPASSAIRVRPTGRPSTPTRTASFAVSPRAAEIMAQRRRGSRPVN
jgi:predicted DNA-binding transcriptional regulator AlpA